MNPPIVTLLSDFGLEDGYVAAMKGVLLSRCPQARLVDVSHTLAPGAIASAAFVLAQAAPWFPRGTVHLAVVDPGVGSKRRALAAEIDGQRYVCPDNGLLHYVAEGRQVRAFELARSELWLPEPSSVFHGRDVFAPVAAFLAGGGALEQVGPALTAEALVALPSGPPSDGARGSVGRVIHVDRFGNLVTDLRLNAQLLAAGAERRVHAQLAGREIPLRSTYSDVPAGELLALCGSSGLLEIAVNGGSAAALLGTALGLVVSLRPSPPG